VPDADFNRRRRRGASAAAIDLFCGPSEQPVPAGLCFARGLV